MRTRRAGATAVLALLAWAGTTSAASYRTQNFVVEAPTPQLAQEFGTAAERYRKEKALEWLGYEMPPWPQPCPLRVTITGQGAGGATQFNFTNGHVYQTMHIEGSLDRLFDSVLPHEVTHTVFAHHFRRPVPRWADEGGAVLSEDDTERARHDRMCRQLLNAGRGMQLRVLFRLDQYPRDVMVLYAQGYSITRYLVDRSDRRTFLNFLGHGMQYGWDSAVQQFYGYRSVSELEQAWLDHLRDPESLIVHNPRPPSGPTNRLVVHDFAPPGLPTLAAPVVARGASPAPGQDEERFAEPVGWNRSPVRLSRPEAERPSAPKRPPVVLFPPEPLPFR